ncbi:MAG: OmpA family protein [Bacteroidia bacterium]|nr:OmpA family protein [Bacteroidia bacterium]MCF8427886.1 OmpA family protein [Bacteroidia bacterium]
MKTIKISIALILLFAGLTINAQDNSKKDYDASMPSWFIGGNLRLGTQFISANQNNWSSMYLNSLNTNIGEVDASKGLNYGLDLTLGYFFGSKKNFGLGTGLQFVSQRYQLNVEKFALEYQSTDNFGSTFRQGLRASNGIEEKLIAKSLGLPVLLLYKKQLNDRWGFNVDLGLVFNLWSKTTYTAQSNFDYEAIYAFDGNGNPIFDPNSEPNADDWLITKAHYEKVNTDGNVNNYFEGLYQQGYNVGLGVNPDKKEGDVKNYTLQTSFFIQPGISYRIKPNLALHGQIAYRRLVVEHGNSSAYRITDKRGDYQTMSDGLSTSTQGLLSFSAGIRYYFGSSKPKPAPDPAPVPAPPVVTEQPKPEPVVVKPAPKPDPAKEKVLVKVKLLDEKYGKPVPGNILIKKGDSVVFNGVADASGLSNFYLDPGSYAVGVTAKGYIPAEESLNLLTSQKGTTKVIELTQPKIEKGLVFKVKAVNFETGSDQLTASSYDILNNMAAMLKEYPQMVIEVAGHTDNVGDDKLNLALSQKRADSVKAYLTSKGVNAKQVTAKGYGESKPIADNTTEEGKLKNRRVEFSVLEF